MGEERDLRAKRPGLSGAAVAGGQRTVRHLEVQAAAQSGREERADVPLVPAQVAGHQDLGEVHAGEQVVGVGDSPLDVQPELFDEALLEERVEPRVEIVDRVRRSALADPDVLTAAPDHCPVRRWARPERRERVNVADLPPDLVECLVVRAGLAQEQVGLEDRRPEEVAMRAVAPGAAGGAVESRPGGRPRRIGHVQHGRLQAEQGSIQTIVSSGTVAVPCEYGVSPSVVGSSVLRRRLRDGIH